MDKMICKSPIPYDNHECRSEYSFVYVCPLEGIMWFVFETNPERVVSIEYCPFCGFKSPKKKEEGR